MNIKEGAYNINVNYDINDNGGIVAVFLPNNQTEASKKCQELLTMSWLFIAL